MAIESNLYKKYKTEIRKTLNSEFSYKTPMQIPNIQKIVINMGLGEAINDKSVVTDAVEELSKITGQKPILTYAKKSNASFKIREGMPIGVKVTLRNQNMWNFLEKAITIALPRIRDFRGLKYNAFDQEANYTFGIREYIVFPEIELDKVSKMKGMDISLITSTKNSKEAYRMLELLGLPFTKKGEN